MEENNLSRMLLALGNRMAFAIGGEQRWGEEGSAGSWSFYVETRSLVYHLGLSVTPHCPFLEALVLYLILEACEKKVGTGN